MDASRGDHLEVAVWILGADAETDGLVAAGVRGDGHAERVEALALGRTNQGHALRLEDRGERAEFGGRRDARGVSNVLRVDDARGEVRVGVRVGIRVGGVRGGADGRGSNAGSRGAAGDTGSGGTPGRARERGTRARAASVDACAEMRDMSVRAIEGARTEVRGWTGRRRAWKPIRNASRAAHEKDTRAGRV